MTVTLHGPEGSSPRANSAAPAGEERPSAAIIRKANVVKEVTDARGRVIKYKKLSALDNMDLQEIAGGANSDNTRWMVYATLAFSVIEIDGERVSRPNNKMQLRALVGRLDDDGLNAVFEDVVPPEQAEGADPARTAEDEARDTAKNSSGTPT